MIMNDLLKWCIWPDWPCLITKLCKCLQAACPHCALLYIIVILMTVAEVIIHWSMIIWRIKRISSCAGILFMPSFYMEDPHSADLGSTWVSNPAIRRSRVLPAAWKLKWCTNCEFEISQPERMFPENKPTWHDMIKCQFWSFHVWGIQLNIHSLCTKVSEPILHLYGWPPDFVG